ncbi:MAG: prepilin-type N-terminal cleavage/methylation domain-containing protein [Terracidiphilus sp.]
MKSAFARGQSGFTLLELAIVLTLTAVVIGGGLVIFTASLQASQYNSTVKKMDDIEKAILNFAIVNNRIPCPSDLTQKPSSSTYGYEAGSVTGGTGTGECYTGMTPAANLKATSGTEEGGVPTRALRLSDDYMYNGWGRRLRYAVDPTYTATSALPVAQCATADSKSITVDDASGAARSTAAAYVLMSHGANGHGAYTSNGVVFNNGSKSVNELANCHCTSAGVFTGTYTPTYYQKTPAYDSGESNVAGYFFDDIVSFKEPWQMQALNYSLASGECGNLYVVDSSNNRVQLFNMSSSWIGSIGGTSSACTSCMCTSSSCPTSSGSGNGQLWAPYDAAIDSSGNIWVVDHNNYRVEKFSSSGSYLSKFGSCGSGNGEFGVCRNGGGNGIAIDSSGNFWVVDGGNKRVEEFNSSGSYLSQFNNGGNFSQHLQFVHVDSSGNIWVSDWATNELEKFNTSGTLLETIGSALTGFGTLGGVNDFTFDASGNIWITTTNNDPGPFSQGLVEVNNSGTYLNGYAYNPGGSPTGIAADPIGNFWVILQGGDEMLKFNSSGTYLSLFGSNGTGNSQFSNPTGIAIYSR